MRTFLLWGFFLPLADYFSLDRSFGKNRNNKIGNAFSVASIVFILQLCVMYWVAVALRTSPSWWEENSAVSMILSSQPYFTPLGKLLLQYPEALKVLTWLSIRFELFGPLLLFVTWRNGLIRLALIVGFTALHLSVAISMNILILSSATIVCWIALIPASFWNGVFSWSMLTKPLNKLGTRNIIDSGIASFLFALVIAWNISTIWFPSREYKISPWGDQFLKVLRLAQTWDMFAPNPYTSGGWMVILARRSNGQEVLLQNIPGSSDNAEKEYSSELFRNSHWRKYYYHLWKYREPRLLAFYSSFSCKIVAEQLTDITSILGFYRTTQAIDMSNLGTKLFEVACPGSKRRV